MAVSMTDYEADLSRLLNDATQAFEGAQSNEAIEQARIEFLGAKSGRLREAQQGLKQVPKEDKPQAGKRFNEVKQQIEAAFQSAKGRLGGGQQKKSSGPVFDPTPPGRRPRLGHLHPITQTIEDLKEIAARLAFEVAEGPEIEDEWHNFEALNIPADHPARDPLENFYIATAGKATGKPMLLRSQTSTVQIRVMESRKPPVRIVSLGRVYRPDTPDPTHFPMFHQVEGLLVDRGITMAHLKTTLRIFASSLLGGDVHIRFRPSFFPFTEPSVEVDMQWQDRWIEMGGAGMVDPNVLSAVGYDPDEVTGFAFGLGVERLCARRHHVTDIREFYKNDIRFLQQF